MLTRCAAAARLPAAAVAVAAVAALAGACDGSSGAVLLPRPPTPSNARLIANGHDTPVGAGALAALRQRLAAAETNPFDGIVVDLGFDKDVTRSVPLDRARFQPAVAELRATPFRKLTENFQDLHLGARNLSWFDDAAFGVIVSNFEAAAALAREAGLRGFFVDNQVYGVRLWSYPDHAAGRSFADVDAKVAERGEAIMAAVLRAFPDVVVLLEFGTSEIFRHVCIERQPLETHLYGLYPAFLEGMGRAIANAKSGAQIIDAYLPAYPTRDPEAFTVYYHLIHANWQRLVESWRPGLVTHWDAAPAGQKRYAWRPTPELTCSAALVSKLGRERPAGFGLMIDYDGSQPFATQPAEFGRNHFTPETLEAVMTAALRRTDRYVWVWHEGFDLWGVPRASTRPLVTLPEAYREALVRARQAAGGTR